MSEKNETQKRTSVTDAESITAWQAAASAEDARDALGYSSVQTLLQRANSIRKMLESKHGKTLKRFPARASNAKDEAYWAAIAEMDVLDDAPAAAGDETANE